MGTGLTTHSIVKPAKTRMFWELTKNHVDCSMKVQTLEAFNKSRVSVWKALYAHLKENVSLLFRQSPAPIFFASPDFFVEMLSAFPKSHKAVEGTGSVSKNKGVWVGPALMDA